MTAKSPKPILSAVFVDYDNIYLSLKRKNEEAAKRFAKDAASWGREIASGRLITPTNSSFPEIDRRIVMNRCYGNPVPRRNNQDNSTDMSSFPFVRHHFLRSGFEVIDCPPLTAQLKNSADIRMVMDVRDFLTHDTYYDEFIVLSGDADFTPLLHRLRAHARRTVIFANDYTAAPYTSICDGEIRESALINFLLEGRLASENESDVVVETNSTRDAALAKEIIAEVVSGVQAAAAPVPLEALADRALRNLGHDKTAGSSWAGAGGFRELLSQALPEQIALTEKAPFYAYDTARHGPPAAPVPLVERAPAETAPAAPATTTGGTVSPAEYATRPPQTAEQSYAVAASTTPAQAPEALGQVVPAQAAPIQAAPVQAAPVQTAPVQTVPEQIQAPVPQTPVSTGIQQPVVSGAPQPASSLDIQQSITRIQEACQAPPIAPPEYRVLFDVMAGEINDNGLTGVQTLTNIASRALAKGIEIKRDDIRFVLEVVSEADPWFEQGASANLFAGRFRNFVVARCRGQGLNLTAEEIDLVETWFAGASDAATAPGNDLHAALNAVPGAQQRLDQEAGQAASATVGQATTPGDIIPAEVYPRFNQVRSQG